MIPLWLYLASLGSLGILSFFVWKSPYERAAWVKRHIIDDEPGQDEGHSAARYGDRTTAPAQRVVPEKERDRIRDGWSKTEEVEPLEEPGR